MIIDEKYITHKFRHADLMNKRDTTHLTTLSFFVDSEQKNIN